MNVRKLFYLLIFLSYSSYSQELFKEYGNREFSDTLNIELLHRACQNLKIDFDDIYIHKSHSLSFTSEITFFAIQYIVKNTIDGNLYKIKYLFVHNCNGRVIDEVDDKFSYYDKEAVQASPSYLLKNEIKLSKNTVGIGVITEEAGNGCVSLYSRQYLSIISLRTGKIKIFLNNYPIRKTQGESNCAGTHEIEILENSIKLMNDKTHGFFDLLVTKEFTYENATEENPAKNIKAKDILKTKTETEKLLFNGVEYTFKKDDILRFLKW